MDRNMLQASADSCPGLSRSEGRQRGCPSPQAFAILAVLLLIVTPTAIFAEAGGHGQPIAQAEYRGGVVTANDGTALHIDGRAYHLHPGVTVTDEDGSLYAIQDLKRGEQIKFHLQNRKIDRIIWILPR